MTCLALDMVSACASVFSDDEVDALQPGRDHVVDGVAAGATDAKNDNARLHLANIGNVGHVCSDGNEGTILLPVCLAVCLHDACG